MDQRAGAIDAAERAVGSGIGLSLAAMSRAKFGDRAAAQAIAGDMSVESYMEAELLRQKGIREQKQQNANPFTALVAKPTPKYQDPGSVPPAPADDLTAFEAKARSAQAHRDAARQRTDERSRKGKASQPLPQDPAAAAP